jgi:hypothetical protein
MAKPVSVRVPHRCQCRVCEQESDAEIVAYHEQINLLLSRLSEPQRRWYVGVLSQGPDSPSDVQLSLITGMDEKTIARGRQEMQGKLHDVPVDRQRQPGAGRPRAEKKTQG